MARTPRASKVSDAKASGETKAAKGKKPAKQAAPTKVSTAGRATAAKKSDAKQRASRVEIPPAAKKAAKHETVVHEQASASKKAAKKAIAVEKAAATEAPAAKKGGKKKTTGGDASASKKATKKAGGGDAPAASKKSAKKAADAPAAKKASKKKPADSEVSSSKKASKKKSADSDDSSSKKASKKKPADSDDSSSKKASKKKSAGSDAPAPKKASKKKTSDQPASEQLAFSMDIDPPATSTTARSGPLQPGDRVPDFSLEGDDGQTYSRQSLAGERFVIYFYPKDDTPGCTREACDFRDNRPRFETAKVKVLGVSSDNLKSHGRFRSKYELNFPLLVDPDRTIAQAFGAVGEKKLYGKTSVGVIRSTFLVGPDGVIEKTFSPVKVDGHAEAVLQAIGSG